MSRRALERGEYRARYVARPPTFIQQPPGANQFGLANIHAINQPFVPIRLTGDETEDNYKHEEVILDSRNVLAMTSSATYNINNMLYNNILESEYFRALYQLRTYHEVVNEIYASVTHVDAWQTGTSRIPSTAFCLLVKFMVMKLTVKQMQGLLSTNDNPFVRAIGILYLRYTCPPKQLWNWFELLLEDDEVFHPSSDTSITTTIAGYCRKLLTDMNYSGTTLPRIPITIERRIKVLLLMLDYKQKRREINKKYLTEYFNIGEEVFAVWGDAGKLIICI